MAATRSARLSRTIKSTPMRLECLHRRGRALVGGPARGHQPAFPGQIRILLRARKREFLFDDTLREHEPRIIVARAHDVMQLAEGIGAWKKRGGQPFAGGIEPHRGWSRQDADSMARPDR